jgi:hypothetical protein
MNANPFWVLKKAVGQWLLLYQIEKMMWGLLPLNFGEAVVAYMSIFLLPLEFLGMIWYIKTKKSGGGM